MSQIELPSLNMQMPELKIPGVEMPEFKGFASFGDSVSGALGQVSGAARAGVQEKKIWRRVQIVQADRRLTAQHSRPSLILIRRNQKASGSWL